MVLVETQDRPSLTPELIQDRMDASLERQRRTSIHRSNWASSLGEPCDRARFLWRTKPETAEPISLDGLRAIANGIEEEAAIKAYLSQLGFTVYTDRPEKKGRWERYNISAWADFWISLNGSTPILAEHKAPTVEWTWAKIDNAADLKGASSEWHRKWYSQCQTTMLVHDEERMLFFLKRPGKKEWKIFWVALDMADAEIAVKRADQDETNVINGFCPPFYEADPTHCQRCPFFGRACNPPLKFNAAQYCADEDMIEAIRRHEELKPLAAEYNALDDKVKKPFKNSEAVGQISIVGDFQITVKEGKRKAYAVAEATTFTVKIDRIASGNKIVENQEEAA
jgi:hypothetical protein